MTDVFTQEQVWGLYNKTLRMLKGHRGTHHSNYDGELHFNTADYQLICDDAEQRLARRELRLPRKHVVHHGETGTIFGTRCVADDQTPMGCVGMGES